MSLPRMCHWDTKLSDCSMGTSEWAPPITVSSLKLSMRDALPTASTLAALAAGGDAATPDRLRRRLRSRRTSADPGTNRHVRRAP
jgi:hypothetical protein